MGLVRFGAVGSALAWTLTVLGLSTHSSIVLARLCRAFLVLALAPCLVGAATMPMEHVHEGDAGHGQSTAHRHFAAHESTPHDYDEIERPHDDDRVVWLSYTSLHRSAYHLSIDWAVTSLTTSRLHDSTNWVAAPLYDASPPHAPPRSSRSPRAPASLHV